MTLIVKRGFKIHELIVNYALSLALESDKNNGLFVLKKLQQIAET